jgi:hypothetical protein
MTGRCCTLGCGTVQRRGADLARRHSSAIGTAKAISQSTLHHAGMAITLAGVGTACKTPLGYLAWLPK